MMNRTNATNVTTIVMSFETSQDTNLDVAIIFLVLVIILSLPVILKLVQECCISYEIEEDGEDPTKPPAFDPANAVEPTPRPPAFDPANAVKPTPRPPAFNPANTGE
jgi:hypothetical protein